MVLKLLERGASLDPLPGKKGVSALVYAVANKHPDIVRILVEHGVKEHGFDPSHGDNL